MKQAANPIDNCVDCGKPLAAQEEMKLPRGLFGPGRYVSYARCKCGVTTGSKDGGTFRAYSMPSDIPDWLVES